MSRPMYRRVSTIGSGTGMGIASCIFGRNHGMPIVRGLPTRFTKISRWLSIFMSFRGFEA
ncbi:uncharacterized protein GLRG_08265 [Colletotrichum graminicola M1.001]|uniref:Uncharacterized protein n=1 Tax=Colletotrichum graminicola (strain M1.001 / M2 / FGSC 10212) TaxID=645133 RepID=E3QQI3_COLGM|nr:uncharacterized protein GLRG_08265 [Colletotrichum graminicola M1.001]EFQ33121.1 hypothetical protein GLRG_08265 [Colletotrichum graminicola M1.001]